MHGFEQYLSNQQIAPSNQIPFLLHWIKRCYTSLRKPTTMVLNQDWLIFKQDRNLDVPGVELPYALERNYSDTGKEWGWQWLFPFPTTSNH